MKDSVVRFNNAFVNEFSKRNAGTHCPAFLFFELRFLPTTIAFFISDSSAKSFPESKSEQKRGNDDGYNAGKTQTSHTSENHHNL